MAKLTKQQAFAAITGHGNCRCIGMEGEMSEQTASHERLMAELVATMAANTRTPLYEIKLTVGAADLDRELGTLRQMRAELEECREYFYERADADGDVTGFTGNEEMGRLVAIDAILAKAAAQ